MLILVEMFRVILFVLISFLCLSFIREAPKFSSKTYGNMANYFETEQELLSFFDLHKGDMVAEVGAAEGHNIAGLALLADGLTLYAEDINAKYLNQKNLDKCVRRISRYKTQITCDIRLVLGNESASLLPENAFDKILLIATLHEFSRMHEMIADLYTKLKPGGKIYVLESVCLAHKNYTAEQTIALMQAHKLQLVKKDGKDLHGSSGLYRAIFVK